MTSQTGYLWIESVRVPFSDMDVLGHASHVAYFRYMQEARVAWVLSLADHLPPDQAPVVVSATCNYLSPVVYPATLEVRMSALEAGRSSFVLGYELQIYAGDGVRKVANGETRMVWTDRRDRRSAVLPEALRALVTPRN
jgi:acyl-CoA thioester hydrolase